MKHLKTISLISSLAISLIASSSFAAERLKMATIAPGTSAYLTMTTFASLVNQNQSEVDITVDATGAATKHGIELAKGKLEFAMSAPTVHFFLKEGKAMYQKVEDHAELAEQLKLVMWFPYGQYHYITYADSGIKTFADMKGKKIFFGPPGGGAWNTGQGWLKISSGLDVKAGDVQNVKASWSSAFQGFQDRQFDVYVNGGISPFPQVEQLALTNKMRLIGMSKEEFDANDAANKWITGLPGRSRGIIKKGIYGDNVEMAHDIHTAGAVVGIITRADMSDEQIYSITKTFWDNVEAAKASTPWLSHITMEYAVQNGGMPLHPGAQRYYEERGVEIPEGSKG
jgi:hypothetical protein